MDSAPKFVYQTNIWVQGLVRNASVAPSDIVVHAIVGCDERDINDLRSLGVTVCTVEPFDERHPYSNKLVQLQSPALVSADYVALFDCDTFIVAPLDEMFGSGMPRAKPVDTSVPPEKVWREIFRRAGLHEPRFESVSTWSQTPTQTNNCNGGLYVLSQHALRSIAAPWKTWDDWLIENRAFLGSCAMNVDQISFALAMEELGWTVDRLPSKFNAPTHLPYDRAYPYQTPPAVLHYHWHVEPDGKLKTTGQRVIDESIARANETISSAMQQVPHIARVWERYKVEEAQNRPSIAKRVLGRLKRTFLG